MLSPTSKALPPTGDQVFKNMSPCGTFLFQTTITLFLVFSFKALYGLNSLPLCESSLPGPLSGKVHIGPLFKLGPIGSPTIIFFVLSPLVQRLLLAGVTFPRNHSLLFWLGQFQHSMVEAGG